MIDVKGLTRHYGEVAVVDDVSFHIERGEVVGLLGHNGAGKTTIMRMMTGFLEPTAGQIIIDGLQVGPATRDIQKRIGYLPENCPLWPEMTVIDLLDFQATLHGLAEEDRPRALRETIARTGLKEKALAPIHTLSRGYRQRVGVAQAILHHPKIVILDEPTNGLDPTQIRHMRTLIGELAREATIIVSTHILQEVQAICDRVLILRSGRLVVDTRLDALASDARLRVTIDRDGESILKNIPGVTSVRKTGTSPQGHLSYILNASLETAPLVAGTLAEKKVQLFVLQPEKRDLETLFAEANELHETAGGMK
ncbi:MAG: ABC transporter ATP-binding protein [Magnetococcales bacterium]|nr:ABC transporter ATP-binding protein [Magnetococcales bacterium]MBF0149598.1 ABC transporter ATP-binding protein [Magnetococcales bacterium]MBF0347868.1 ABC transporter ATP-binding protein [Magnetococcales bacterium]